MNVNITVLADDKLGGVLREYREAKRRADVGERIKIVDAWCSCGMYETSDILTVDSVDECGDIYVDAVKTGGNDEGYITEEEYVVLEPTDIVQINGERLRMVEREAGVGDRIIFDRKRNGITAGKAYVIDSYMTFRDDDEDRRWIEHIGAIPTVLEPVDPPLSSRPASEQYAENIAALESRIRSLEGGYKQLYERVETLEGRLQPTVKTTAQRPKTRDEIVEQAKRDVAKLLAENYVNIYVWFAEKDGYVQSHYVEFVVNRNKRTVVALIRDEDSGEVEHKGVAKCAPGDVFNVHIGKAIALRRALGLEVPAEYLSTPLPSEPQVGDIVRGSDPSCGAYYSADKTFTLTKRCGEDSFRYAEKPTD